MQNIAPSNVKQIKNAINQIKSSPNRRGSMFSLTNIQECESNDFNSRLSFSEGGPAYVEKKVEKLENTYIMEPEYNPSFFGPDLKPKTDEIRELAKGCLENNLTGEEYEPLLAREFSRNLADDIKKRVQLMDGFPNKYKVMVMVFVGELKENLEMRIASRMMGLKYDTWCDAKFVGQKIWGCAQVYLVFQE